MEDLALFRSVFQLPIGFRPWRSFGVLWLAALSIAPAGRALATEPSFNRDVRPILAEKCFQCHGPDAAARKAKLRLDDRDSALDVLSPGSPTDSELLSRVLDPDPDERMPPRKTHQDLTADEIEILRDWIAKGAAYEAHWSFIPVTKPQPPEVDDPSWISNPIDRFVLARLEREDLAPAPEADPHTTIRRITLDLTGIPPTPGEVDAFVNDIRDSSTAEQLPNAEDSDNSAFRIPSSALDNLVARLLASPRYAEHFAYEWLDAARYADSDGYENDPVRTMWPWRDWVVRAFDENMPYDRFIIEQLAGDLLENPTVLQQLATGFNRNHPINNEGGILPEEWIVEYICDRAETTASVFLGLTWNCTRCHDHKYDPITQKDYYRLFAFFNRLPEKGSARGGSTAFPMMKVPHLEKIDEFQELTREMKRYDEALSVYSDKPSFEPEFRKWFDQLEQVRLTAEAERAKENPEIREELSEKEKEKKAKMHEAAMQTCFLQSIYPPSAHLRPEFSAAKKRYEDLRKDGILVMIMEDMEEPPPTHILERGLYDQPGEEVTAGTPAFLPPMKSGLPRNRLGLAQWIVDRENPLTARVAVNRVWQHYFGTGLVKTQADFGVQGELPSHPGLLDWLAVSFIDSGWNLKELHRLIVTSSTYRQSSATSASLAQRDPDNRLLARAPRHRLPAATIRDQALAVSGLLVEKSGGPSVKPYQPEGLWRDILKERVEYDQGSGPDLYRRSLYTFWRRAVKPPLMTLLDANFRDNCDMNRKQTNTPLQALLLMNDVTFVEAARGLATRMLREGGGSDAERIAHGMQLVTGRPPTPDELATLRLNLESIRAHYRLDTQAAAGLIRVGESEPDPGIDPAQLAAHTALARVLLNLDETLTKQ